MNSISLTKGAILSIISEGESSIQSQPVVQIVSIELFDDIKERFTVCISDGDVYVKAILAPKLNRLVRDGALNEGSVVQLRDLMFEGGSVIIIVDLKVLVEEADIIGEPVKFSKILSTPEKKNTQKIKKQLDEGWITWMVNVKNKFGNVRA